MGGVIDFAVVPLVGPALGAIDGGQIKALALASSIRNQPLDAATVAFGELGLTGEVRPVQRGQERLREAAKLGFTHAIVPKANKPRQRIEGLTVVAVERVGEAVEVFRG